MEALDIKVKISMMKKGKIIRGKGHLWLTMRRMKGSTKIWKLYEKA